MLLLVILPLLRLPSIGAGGRLKLDGVVDFGKSNVQYVLDTSYSDPSKAKAEEVALDEPSAEQAQRKFIQPPTEVHSIKPTDASSNETDHTIQNSETTVTVSFGSKNDTVLADQTPIVNLTGPTDQPKSERNSEPTPHPTNESSKPSLKKALRTSSTEDDNDDSSSDSQSDSSDKSPEGKQEVKVDNQTQVERNDTTHEGQAERNGDKQAEKESEEDTNSGSDSDSDIKHKDKQSQEKKTEKDANSDDDANDSDTDSSSGSSSENKTEIHTTPSAAKKSEEDTKDTNVLRMSKKPKPHPTKMVPMTTVYSSEEAKPNFHSVFEKARLVKNDSKVQQFITNIKQKSILLFFYLKDKLSDPEAKETVDFLARSYQQKFDEFIAETQNQNIKTSRGTERVIMNILESSNSLMKRLLSFLSTDLTKGLTLRTDVSVVLKDEFQQEEKDEYFAACTEFNVCRSTERFSLYAAEFITEIVKANTTDRVKLAVDTFTEVFKDADYSKFVNHHIKKQMIEMFDSIDLIPSEQLRSILIAVKNMMVSKNKPLAVMSANVVGSPMNKTVAFMDLIDIIDDQLQPTKKAVKQWKESLKSIQEWSSGSRNDIMDIMTKFSSFILSKAAKKSKGSIIEAVGSILKTLSAAPDDIIGS